MIHLVASLPVLATLVWFALWLTKAIRIRRRIDKMTKLSDDIRRDPSRENLNRAAKEFGWPRLP
jgi:hypothetical protein